MVTEVFIVFRRAVYRHEVVGIAATETQAIDLLAAAVKAEKDSHHTIELRKYPLPYANPCPPDDYGFNWGEPGSEVITEGRHEGAAQK